MFRFSIRELMLLITVVALALGLVASMISDRRGRDESLFWRGAAYTLKDEMAKDGKEVRFEPPLLVELPDRSVIISRGWPPE